MPATFDLQGHRGARGLRPESTLPAFETALDLLVTTLETDLHLTRDGVPVLTHDARVSLPIYRRASGTIVPEPTTRPLLSALTLEQVRGYVADGNPNPRLWTEQTAGVTPVAQAWCRQSGRREFGIPTLAELFEFVAAYAGHLGRAEGKTEAQRQRAGQVRFNLELKRTPFRPEHIGDTFGGTEAGAFERAVVEVVRQAGVVGRTVLQSFDQRSVRAAKELEPRLETAVLITGTAPGDIPALAREVNARIYSPDFEFLDQEQVRQSQRGGLRVIPWTVNEVEDMGRLLNWGVDGLITDYPNRLANLLHSRHLEF